MMSLVYLSIGINMVIIAVCCHCAMCYNKERLLYNANKSNNEMTTVGIQTDAVVQESVVVINPHDAHVQDADIQYGSIERV